MTTAFTDAQVAVVQALAADAPGPNWLRLVADVEIQEVADSYHFDTVALAVLKGADGALSDPSFSVSEPMRRAIVDLYRQRKDIAGELFSGFELRIDNDGAFRFEFSYRPPKRMNGAWDEAKERMLDNYLEHYRAEIARSEPSNRR
ncbi:hypothetical protein [Caulobacter sp. LARHSG274]